MLSHWMKHMAAVQNRKRTRSQEACYFPQLFTHFTGKFRDSWESRFAMEVPTGLGLQQCEHCSSSNSPKSKLNHAMKGTFQKEDLFFLDNSCDQNQISKKIFLGIPAHFILSSRLLRPHFLPLGSKVHFSPRRDLKIHLIWALPWVWLAARASSADFPKLCYGLHRTWWQKHIPWAKPSAPSQHDSAAGTSDCRALDWPST